MNELAPCPSQQIFVSYGLMSLLDMLEIKAKHFYSTVHILSRIEHILETSQHEKDTEVEGKNRDRLIPDVRMLAGACIGLGATVTAAAVTRLERRLTTNDCSYNQLGDSLKDIRQRLIDELKESTILCLNGEESGYFSSSIATFGFDVTAIFSSEVAEDLDEAGKCIAIGRGTASVFHIMRAMESVVQKLGAKLGTVNTDKEWGKILSDIHEKIKLMPKGADRDEWSECHANLYHVKQAWRNPTMHPKQTYTIEQTKEIFGAVRIFMKHLSALV